MVDFFEMIGSRSERLRSNSAQPRMAVVTSSDPATGSARVLLQPEGVLSGWLPVLTQWAGAGWGISCPLAPGDQVFVIPQEGDAENGIIVGRVCSNSARPPDAAIGEIILRHQSGSSLRLLNSGIVCVHGDLHVAGDIYDMHGSLSHLRNNFNAHTHFTMGKQTTLPDHTD